MASFLITAANSITQTGGTAGILDGNANNSLFVAAQGFIVQNGSADTVRFSFVGVTTHTIVVDGTIRSTGGAGSRSAPMGIFPAARRRLTPRPV